MTAMTLAPTMMMLLSIPTHSDTSPFLLPIELHAPSTAMAEVGDKPNNLLDSLAQLSAMMAKMLASAEAILAAVTVHSSVPVTMMMPSSSLPLNQSAFPLTTPSLHPYLTPFTCQAFVLTATQLKHQLQVEATKRLTTSMATVSSFDLCHPTIPGITPANNPRYPISTCFHCSHQLWYESTAHIQLPAHSLTYPRKPTDPSTWCQQQPHFPLYYPATPPHSVL